VIALDAESERVVRVASFEEWGEATFYSASDPGHELISMSNRVFPLDSEIENSHTLVMVSNTGENAEAAATIGAACLLRGITTVGLVLTPGRLTSDALMALRPYARILLVPAEEDDLVELLRAIRA
jgi:hypothetical protein